MLRSALLAMTLCLVTYEVKCKTLDEASQSREKLMASGNAGLPANVSRFMSELSSLQEVSINAPEKNYPAGTVGPNRTGKFFIPNFEFRAGLNVGALSPSNLVNIENLAKITKATNLPTTATFNPYIAALYDPYNYVSPPYTTEQAFFALYRLLASANLEQANSNKIQTNTNRVVEHVTSKYIADEDDSVNRINDRKKKKNKSRIRNKPMKQEIEEEIYEDHDYMEFSEAHRNREPSSNFKPRQGITTSNGTTTTTTTTTAAPIDTTTSITTTTVSSNMTDKPTYPNYPLPYPAYYGGQPQSIDNVAISYDLPNSFYGPPFSNPTSPTIPWNPPSHSYGPPSQSYGSPLPSYGSPSPSYVPSSPAYVPPAPSYGPPVPSYGTPAPSYGPPAPSYGSLGPSYDSSVPSYGPPAPSYGLPSQPYNPTAKTSTASSQITDSSGRVSNPSSQISGSPSRAYNQPTQISGPPSQHYSWPINSYGQTALGHSPYQSYHSQEAILYEEPAGNSVVSTGSWQQYSPIGRSRSFVATTIVPSISNPNSGFVPI